MMTDDYIEFLTREYLQGFIAQGGAAVKFVVCPGSRERSEIREEFARVAAEHNFVQADIDAATTRIHLIHEVFNDIAGQVDWDDLARRHVERSFRRLEMRLPMNGGPATLDAVADMNDYHRGELRRELNRELQRSVVKDYAMAPEFRVAMLRLCQAQAEGSPETGAVATIVRRWLLGEVRFVSELRPVPLFQRIARHNARFMLYSLSHWVKKVGMAGFVLGIDLARVTERDRSAPGPGFLTYYKTSIMDTYEVLRQLVDATDQLTATIALVTVAPEFLTDDQRGLGAYQALRFRVWDDVRDRRRQNPYGTLVRLERAAGTMELAS